MKLYHSSEGAPHLLFVSYMDDDARAGSNSWPEGKPWFFLFRECRRKVAAERKMQWTCRWRDAPIKLYGKIIIRKLDPYSLRSLRSFFF